eukprot:906307-Pelagomonas_calceolata.AAC.1
MFLGIILGCLGCPHKGNQPLFVLMNSVKCAMHAQARHCSCMSRPADTQPFTLLGELPIKDLSAAPAAPPPYWEGTS